MAAPGVRLRCAASTPWPSASAAWRLGAGRARKEDPVSAIAGVVWRATVGDEVDAGQPLLELHLDDPARLPSALEALTDAIEVSDAPVDAPAMVLGRVT